MITPHTPKTSHYKKKFVKYVRMINLSLNELKLIAKSRSIQDYKNKSKEYLKKYSANQNQK